MQTNLSASNLGLDELRKLIEQLDRHPQGRAVLYPSGPKLLMPKHVLNYTLAKPRSHQWPALERKFKAANPNCFVCGGSKLIQVHHAQPFHLFPHLELEWSNLRSLCMAPGHFCHFVFGHLFRWSNYNLELDREIRHWRKMLELPRLKIVA